MENISNNLAHMRLLNIVQRYHPAKGGAELFVKIISEYMASLKGNSVDLWTTDVLNASSLWDLDGELIEKKQEIINGVNISRFPIGTGLLKYKYPNKIYRTLLSNLPDEKMQSLGTCPTVFSMLDKAEHDSSLDYNVITVSSSPYYFLFYVGYQLSKRLDIPLILAPALHTGIGDNDSLKGKYLKKAYLKYYEYADKVLLNTTQEGVELIKFANELGVVLSDKKFEVIGQGIFPNDIKGGNGPKFKQKYNIKGPIVFQIGSMNPDKGSITLVEASKILWSQGLKFTLVFGGGRDVNFDKHLLSLDENTRENIVILENISEEDKYDLFDAGDIFSMVSKTDSFGIVYLEAWFYNKPVLACKNKVMQEIITDNEEGFLTEFGNAIELAKKIDYLLTHENERVTMGNLGRKKVLEKYNWEKNVLKIKAIYDNF